MTAILVVCTGNVCRSPMAEGFLRDLLARRFGDRAPLVSSAGIAGWEGSGAMEESVRAARELGADISSHVAHRLTGRMVDGADLVLAMAVEHRDAVADDLPEAAGRTYTLKELVRLLHALPSAARADPGSLPARIAEVDAARHAGLIPPARDEDVADPLGQPIDAYRAVAWELEDLLTKLVDGLWGPVRARTEAAGGGR